MENHGGIPSKPRRTLTPEQKRRILEKRRKARLKKRLMIIVPIAVVLLALLVVLILVTGGAEDKAAEADIPAAEIQMEAADVQQDAEASFADDALQGADAEAPADDLLPPGEDVGELEVDEGSNIAIAANTAVYSGEFDYDSAYIRAALGETTGPELNYDYYSKIDPAKLTRWTEAKPGCIPLLSKAKTDEKIIAVTVDDCFQANNLMQIVQCAIDNNADLTIFPIGNNLEKEGVANALRYAYQAGFEIGNHTYNHAGMYHYDQKRMEMEIWYQQMKVNEVLGVNYTQNFFRPKGGDERNDQRVHAYLHQLGYSGIAVWTQSGSTDSLDSLYNNLEPGRIYLFHTTDNDLNKLLQFIPGAIQRGYRLVTLSEMFGLPENQVSELTLTTAVEPPKMEAVNIVLPSLKRTTYIRAAAVVQQRLIDLGWLEGAADGVFGYSSFLATGFFQMACEDITPTGVMDPVTQARLFADDAPTGSQAKIEEFKRQLGK